MRFFRNKKRFFVEKKFDKFYEQKIYVMGTSSTIIPCFVITFRVKKVSAGPLQKN